MNAAKFSPRPTGSTIVNRTLPGGDRRQVAEHHRLEDRHRLGLAGVGRLDQHRPLHRERDQGGEREARRPGGLEPRVARDAVGDLGEVDLELAEPQRRGDGGRGLPGVEVGRVVPVEEQAGAFLPDLLDRLPELVEAAPPAVGQRVPGLLVLAGGCLALVAMGVLELLRLALEPLLELGQLPRVALVDLLQRLLATPLDVLQEGRILLVGRAGVGLATLLGLGRDPFELLVGGAGVGVAALGDLDLLALEGRLRPLPAPAGGARRPARRPAGTAGGAATPGGGRRRPARSARRPPAPRRSPRRPRGHTSTPAPCRAGRRPPSRG